MSEDVVPKPHPHHAPTHFRFSSAPAVSKRRDHQCIGCEQNYLIGAPKKKDLPSISGGEAPNDARPPTPTNWEGGAKKRRKEKNPSDKKIEQRNASLLFRIRCYGWT